VSLIDVWDAHVRAIQQEGLQMTGLKGSYTVRPRATTVPAEIPKADAVLICVNAYSTAEAAQAAAIVLKDNGYALTLQNGVGNVETLAGVLGQQRVLAGLSFQSGDLEAPGRVNHTNNGETYLGELDRSRTERLEKIRGLMEEAGLNPVIVDDVVSTIWAKFVHNCGINALCAISGLRPGEIQEVPAFDEFQTGIIEEAVALVRAKGIQLPEDPLGTIKNTARTISPALHDATGPGTDYEIDALNGYVAEAATGSVGACNDALTHYAWRQHRRADGGHNELSGRI
jgi:2-dehydropantoate 2-reductase